MSWPMVKLGELCVVVRGSSPRPKGDPRYYGGNVPRLMVSDVTRDGKFVTPQIDFLTEAGAQKSRPMKKGDFVIAVSGQPGQALILAVDACIHDGFAGLKELDEKRISKDFLFHFMNFVKAKFSATAAGAIFLNLTTEQIRELEIPLPPLAEQKRIAAILDKADSIRHKRQQAIQLADDFLRAVFLEMFGDPVTNPKGWEVKSLRDVLKSISSGWSANGDSRPCEEGELGVLKISAVTSGTFIPTENKAVQVSDIPSSKKLVFPKKGDMLFSRANTRELVAASCIVVEDSLNTFLPDKLWLIKTDESQLLPEFLNYLLKIPGFKEKLTSQATGSSGSMLNISMGKFEQTDCLIPPIDLQHSFKNLYWKLQETLSSFGQSESTLQASFNSLSQKAFSGHL